MDVQDHCIYCLAAAGDLRRGCDERPVHTQVPLLKSDNAQYTTMLNTGKNAAINAIDKKYNGFGKYIAGKAAQLKHIRYVSKADSQHTFSAR